ncbi:MAG TPA: hemerythrin domain-containing protein [Acidimicrobiales bacterium]|nr:hemerythrin domain-containing protein [Acidimicrobiales bacterium]
MARAAAARTAEPPPIEGEDETTDLVSVIGWQHNQVRYLQEQLEAIPGVSKGGDRAKQQQRVSIVDMMRLRLAPHETAEAQHLWPTVRKYLPEGDALVDKALAQETEGTQLLMQLDAVPGGDPQFDELVEELSSALRKHVAHEDLVLLRVSEEVPVKVRDDLGKKFLRAFKELLQDDAGRPAERKGRAR